MASKMIRVHMRNREVNMIPESNIHNFKRIFHAQIDYIEEDEGAPIISKPVIEEIKKPIIEAIKTPPSKADESMSKKDLQDMATAKGLTFKNTDKKAILVGLINA